VAGHIRLGEREVGAGRPAYVVAEIGINHNGDLALVKQLVAAAVAAGCDAVKFQKRTPERCVPEELRDALRETPWGTMSYLEYRRRIELDRPAYEAIDAYCGEQQIAWFASVWDQASVDFLEPFGLVAYKIASAKLTDDALLQRVVATGRPIILSTGMSTMEEIVHAVSLLDGVPYLLTHCTSIYPAHPDELNLSVIRTLAERFDCPVGYSGHEVGLSTTCAAVAIGASLVERHITLDRAMWGSDQAASVEPWGFMRLVRDIRDNELAMGDGVKRVLEREKPNRARLRNRI